jgi:2-polyprenyl-3-methyl-5-hydroxy-6-metoxy-1,4-benzoquinol methylase
VQMLNQSESSTRVSGVEVVCPICGVDKPRTLFWTKDYVFGCSDDSFRMNRCSNCGCGYLSPRPRIEEMAAYYPPEFYWAWEGESSEPDWTAIVRKREGQLTEKAKWLDGVEPGSLLDIGAQKGEFLWFMQQRGWEVEGIELDNQVPNPADMPIKYGDFLEMDFGERKYDVITFWAVLEHVYDPALFVEKAAKLLKPGGRLVALVTNLNSIQSRFYQADDYPRHLTIFTKKSIKRLCNNVGLSMKRVSTGQEIFGGSLSGGLLYFVKRLFGYKSTEALTEWRQFKDPDLFWCKWHGTNSYLVKTASRIDRMVNSPLEKVLDKLGFGQILTFSAEAPDND